MAYTPRDKDSYLDADTDNNSGHLANFEIAVNAEVLSHITNGKFDKLPMNPQSSAPIDSNTIFLNSDSHPFLKTGTGTVALAIGSDTAGTLELKEGTKPYILSINGGLLSVSSTNPAKVDTYSTTDVTNTITNNLASHISTGHHDNTLAIKTDTSLPGLVADTEYCRFIVDSITKDIFYVKRGETTGINISSPKPPNKYFPAQSTAPLSPPAGNSQMWLDTSGTTSVLKHWDPKTSAWVS